MQNVSHKDNKLFASVHQVIKVIHTDSADGVNALVTPSALRAKLATTTTVPTHASGTAEKTPTAKYETTDQSVPAPRDTTETPSQLATGTSS